MGLLKGKKAIIFGVANERSIAWAIAKRMHEEGAELAFTFVGDALEKRVQNLQEAISAGDLETLQSLSRQLKGVSGGYGFEVISEMATVVEESVKSNLPFLEVNRQVQNLIILCRRARADAPDS